MFKKGQDVLFYVRRYRLWILGKVHKELEYDPDLKCNIYLIKDETGSNWAVEEGLVTNQPKKGMRICNLRTFKTYTI